MLTDPDLTALGFDDDTPDADQGKLTTLRGHGLRLQFPPALKLTPRDLMAAAIMQAGADAVQAHQQKLRALLGFDLAGHGAVRPVR